MNLPALRDYLKNKLDSDLGDLLKEKLNTKHSIEGKMLILALSHAMTTMADIMLSVLMKLEEDELNESIAKAKEN